MAEPNADPALAPAPEPTPAVEPSVEPTPSDNWLEMLSPELRENATIKDTPDVNTLAQRVVDLKSQVGSSIRIPGPDADEEVWNEFNSKLQERVPGLMRTPDLDDPEQAEALYKQLGRPEDKDGYQLPEIEGLEIMEDRVGLLKDAAFEAGISNKQFEKVLNKVLQADAQQMGQAKEAQKAGMDALAKEWAGAFDTNKGKAVAAAKALDAPVGLVQALEDGSANPEFYKHYATLHGKFNAGEGDGSLLDAGGTQPERVTRHEIEERFNEITDRMLGMNINDPQYKILFDRRLKLSELLSDG